MPPESASVLLFTTLLYACGLFPEIAAPLSVYTTYITSFLLRLVRPFSPLVLVLAYGWCFNTVSSSFGFAPVSLLPMPSWPVVASLLFFAVAAVLSLLWRQRVLSMQPHAGPYLSTRARTSNTHAADAPSAAVPAAAPSAPAPSAPSRGRGRGPARRGRGRGRAGHARRVDDDAADPRTDPHFDSDAPPSPLDAPDYADAGAHNAAPTSDQFVTRSEMGDLLHTVQDVSHTLHNLHAPRSRRARSPSVSDDEQYDSDSDDDSPPPSRKHNKKKKHEPFSLPSAGLDLDSNKPARDRHSSLADLSKPLLKIEETVSKMARDPTIPRDAVRKLDKHTTGALSLLRKQSLHLFVGATHGWQAVEHMQRMAHLPPDVRSVLKASAPFAKPPPQPRTRPTPSPFIPRSFPSRTPPPSAPIFSNDFSFAPPPSVRPPLLPPPSGRSFPLLPPPPQPQTPPPGSCRICWSPDHWARECPHKSSKLQLPPGHYPSRM